jgi:hypothetical protein
MPSDSDWILYFPHPNYDTTMLNNTFIWELGSRTGRYGTRFRFVDVFVNEDGGDLTLSDRKGVYTLAEKVKRDAQRVDFDALSADGTTGGWLLSINRMDAIPASGFPTENGATSPQFFHTPGPNRILQTAPNAAGSGDDIPRQYNAFINFENPNGYAINVAQRAAIENWHRDFENVFYDNNTWLDPVNGYRQYLDTRDFIDYFHLLNLGKQGDGLLLSIYPWVSSGERKLRTGPMWDFNNGAFSGSTTDTLYFRQDRLWYPRLFEDPAYLREHVDRWYALRRGPLSNLSMTSLIDEQAAGIPDSLVPGQGVALTTWRNRVTAMKSWVTARANWIDSQWLAPPALSLDANVLTIFHPTAGSLYYTTDGSDPLDSATAVLYQAPVPLSQSVNVRTRLLAGSEWSALNEDTYRIGTPASSSNLVISEIMYNPAIGTEFIELQNISTTETVDLTGVRFITGINYDFQVGTTLTPGQNIVITEAEFLNATRLANGGEQLVLSGENDIIIRDFTYGDQPPWPEAADGDGYSLILISPESNPDHGTATNWRRSADLGGNSGTSDAIPYVSGTPLLLYALTDVNAFSVSINESGAPDFSLPVNVAADQAIVTIEQSTDLINWTPLGQPTNATYYRLRVTLR